MAAALVPVQRAQPVVVTDVLYTRYDLLNAQVQKTKAALERAAPGSPEATALEKSVKDQRQERRAACLELSIEVHKRIALQMNKLLAAMDGHLAQSEGSLSLEQIEKECERIGKEIAIACDRYKYIAFEGERVAFHVKQFKVLNTGDWLQMGAGHFCQRNVPGILAVFLACRPNLTGQIATIDLPEGAPHRDLFQRGAPDRFSPLELAEAWGKAGHSGPLTSLLTCASTFDTYNFAERAMKQLDDKQQREAKENGGKCADLLLHYYVKKARQAQKIWRKAELGESLPIHIFSLVLRYAKPEA